MSNLFHPARADGRNASADSAISVTGRAAIGERYTIAARTGRAVRLNSNERLTIYNTHGHQVCDFWAFCDPNTVEYLSMAHCHTSLGSVIPRQGDQLVTNQRQPILEIVHDSSPGIHDTVIAACDLARYQQLGVADYHDNCTDNLRMSLQAIGLAAPAIPAPFNIWMNIPIDPDGRIDWQAPLSQPGDQITFRALRDCIAVMSACPQDMTPVNGIGVVPTSLEFEVNQG